MKEYYNKLKPSNSLLLWITISIVIVTSLLAITLIPYLVYPSVSYDGDLALKWIAITGGLISAGVAIERFREATRARKAIESPKIVISKAKHFFSPETVYDGVGITARSHVLISLGNYGKGHAFNLNIQAYILDCDRIEWMSLGEFNSEHVQFLEKIDYKFPSYASNNLKGDDYNLVLDLRYEDIFNEVHQTVLYLNIDDEDFKFIQPANPDPLETGKKYQVVKEFYQNQKMKYPEIHSIDITSYSSNHFQLTEIIHGQKTYRDFSLFECYKDDFLECLPHWPTYGRSRFDNLKSQFLRIAETHNKKIEVELQHDETGFITWHFRDGKKLVLFSGGFFQDDEHHCSELGTILNEKKST